MTQTSGASRRGNAKSYLAVIAWSESDEAFHLSFSRRKSWVASRSLSSGAHSRDPLAGNDGINSCASWLFEI
jgi:hypothetical protein